MQGRIAKIVPRLSEEKLIEELLATNDEMNSAFTRYQRSAASSYSQHNRACSVSERVVPVAGLKDESQMVQMQHIR